MNTVTTIFLQQLGFVFTQLKEHENMPPEIKEARQLELFHATDDWVTKGTFAYIGLKGKIKNPQLIVVISNNQIRFMCSKDWKICNYERIINKTTFEEMRSNYLFWILSIDQNLSYDHDITKEIFNMVIKKYGK